MSAIACFKPGHTIFSQSSPRFKQMFMYMAGYEDEDRFDREVVAQMTLDGCLEKIRCPTLLATGEFDPLSPLEDAIDAFAHLRTPKELWVFENQFHQLKNLENLGGLDGHNYVFDWLGNVLRGPGLKKNHRRMAYVRVNGDGPWGRCDWVPPVTGGQAYF